MTRLTALVPALLVATAAPAQELPPVAAPPGLGQEMRLSLSDAAELALELNLDLDIARTAPQVAREIVGQAEGSFDPFGFAEWRFEHTETPIASRVQSAFGSPSQIDADQWSYTAGFSGIRPFGLSYSSAWNMNRVDTNSGFNSLEPEFRTTMRTELVLPLLKDLIHNTANVALKRSRIARRITDDDFETFVSELIEQVERSYWDLAARRAEERVAGKSLETARDLLSQTEVQYQVGVVSKVAVVQADAGVADREFGLIAASNVARLAQDQLLDTIAVPSAEQFRLTRIVLDEPAYYEYTVEEESSIAAALDRRSELSAARGQVEDAEVQLAFARNQVLPTVDLVASYTMDGLSGDPKLVDTNGDGVPDLKPDLGVPDASLDSMNDWFRAGGAHGWAVGARLEIPIGNRTARHTAVQREIELRRSRRSLRRLEQQILLEVRRAVRNVLSATEGLKAAERNVGARTETLRAEEERLRLGDSTPFQVLEHEEDLVEAERQQIGAFQVYLTSIAELQRAEGTLLEKRGIDPEALVFR